MTTKHIMFNCCETTERVKVATSEVHQLVCNNPLCAFYGVIGNAQVAVTC